MALVRAGGVPARFRIGFNVPKTDGGTIAGYHCWAESKSKKKDRVGVSLGRDVKFDGQKGDALNYFVFPYAEIDGKPVKVETKIAFEERS
jgi:hypothetical protein